MRTRFTAILLFILLALSSLAGCAQSGADTETQTAAASDAAQSDSNNSSNASAAEISSLSVEVSESDTNDTWDDSATKITLDGSTAAVDGSGASVSGNVVTIVQAGDYVVSGTLDDGQIAIAATSSDKVHLVLNGVDITNKTGAPIYASQCDKLIVTLAGGTQNTLTDGGGNFQYTDTANEEPNAALFSKDDLTINGTGSLTVTAGFNNGIGTKDDLLILDGNITIDAANHGIRGNDSIAVQGGVLHITAGNDGMQTNNTEDTTLGWILIEGGVFDITSAHDGMQADTALAVTGGEFTITAGAQIVSTDTTSDSYKGIKSAGSISISGGGFAINSADDAVHGNGSISISGGEFTLSTGDDGVHADGDLTVSAGNIKITESYEGLEAANLIITGGTIDATSSDDALNAAGGTDQSGGGGQFGGGDEFASSGAYSITISGGDITFTAGGDGIDSNGTVDISGGTVVSLIESTADNGAIDLAGTFTVTGGTIIYGGTGVGQAPGGSATQSYVFIDTGVSAGSEITVKKDGQVLITFTPTIGCQYLAMSSPDIVSGESYEVYSGGTLLTTVTAGTGVTGGMGGGMGDMGGGMGGGGNPR